MDLTRRHLFRMAGYGLGASALTSLIEKFKLATALAAAPGSGYKALVCIHLGGGNDGNNMIIPYDNYATYRNLRGADLSIPQDQLANRRLATSIGNFAMHPRLGDAGPAGEPVLYDLYAQSKLAVVLNVGPLVRNLTRSEYQTLPPATRPYQLFSHSDQVEIWQTARADSRAITGWGGRIADRVPSGGPRLTTITSISGSQVFNNGNSSNPLIIAAHPTTLRNVLVLNGFGSGTDETARRNAFNFFRTIDRDTTLVRACMDVTQQTSDIASLFNVNDPTFAVQWPANNGLANQLWQVAKVIKLVTTSDPPLATRQIFFVSQGGYDTHGNQLNDQRNNFYALSLAMRAFYEATVEMGLQNSVTTFTSSDFSRTYQPSGSGASVGSDHAWGNNHLVMGGAVNGGQFYGVPRDPTDPTTIHPTLVIGSPSPSDTDNRGRWIPSVAVEQYAATLATWFGLAAGDLNYVFPLLNRFNPANLGFV